MTIFCCRKIKLTEIFHPKPVHIDPDQRPPKKILVQGAPGIGKTILCRKLAYDWAKGEQYLSQFKVVFLLEARHITGNIAEEIFKQLLPKDDYSFTNSFYDDLKMACKQGKVLFIIDGFDELRDNVHSDLNDLLSGEILRGAFIVTSSRPDNIGTLKSKCDQQLVNRGFTIDNARNYVEKYFTVMNDEKSCEGLQEAIGKGSIFAQLAENPLNVTLLCIIWQDNQNQFPETRTELYMDLVSCILKRFCSKTGLNVVKYDYPSDVCDCFLSLCKAAFDLLSLQKSMFQDDDFQEDQMLRLGFTCQEVSMARIQNTKFYSFPHRTVQEFLASIHVIRNMLFEGDFHLTRSDMVKIFCTGLLNQLRQKNSKLTYLNETVVACKENDNQDNHLSQISAACCNEDCMLELTWSDRALIKYLLEHCKSVQKAFFCIYCDADGVVREIDRLGFERNEVLTGKILQFVSLIDEIHIQCKSFCIQLDGIILACLKYNKDTIKKHVKSWLDFIDHIRFPYDLERFQIITIYAIQHYLQTYVVHMLLLPKNNTALHTLVLHWVSIDFDGYKQCLGTLPNLTKLDITIKGAFFDSLIQLVQCLHIELMKQGNNEKCYICMSAGDDSSSAIVNQCPFDVTAEATDQTEKSLKNECTLLVNMNSFKDCCQVLEEVWLLHDAKLVNINSVGFGYNIKCAPVAVLQSHRIKTQHIVNKAHHNAHNIHLIILHLTENNSLTSDQETKQTSIMKSIETLSHFNISTDKLILSINVERSHESVLSVLMNEDIPKISTMGIYKQLFVDIKTNCQELLQGINRDMMIQHRVAEVQYQYESFKYISISHERNVDERVLRSPSQVTIYDDEHKIEINNQEGWLSHNGDKMEKEAILEEVKKNWRLEDYVNVIDHLICQFKDDENNWYIYCYTYFGG